MLAWNNLLIETTKRKVAPDPEPAVRLCCVKQRQTSGKRLRRVAEHRANIRLENSVEPLGFRGVNIRRERVHRSREFEHARQLFLDTEHEQFIAPHLQLLP